MTEVSESSKFVFVQVSEEMKPADEESMVKRSLFFSHSVHAHLKQNLLIFIARCKAGEFGALTKESLEESTDDWSFGQSLKELTSTTIHSVGLEQGGPKAPIWLIRFLFESQQETDSLFPEPPVSEIIERRAALSPGELLTDVGNTVAARIGIPPDGRAYQQLQNLITSGETYINELLVFSLTQPVDALNQHLSKYS